MQATHYLSPLLEPQSVAVVGASDQQGSIGHIIFRNLISGGFRGRVWPVNPHHAEVLGQPAFSSIDKIDGRIDLAVVTIAPRGLPQVIEQCGRAGVRHVIIVSDLDGAGAAGAQLKRRVLDLASSLGIRLLGSKSLGTVRPQLGLNATFTEIKASPGDLAVVAQSGAMCAAVLDWAAMNRIGVSSVVALGTAMDIDFGEVLDYLVSDGQTRYILMHIERIQDARHFMSALRSAARVKPIILLKSGNAEDMVDTGTDPIFRVREDAVFDAAVKRAGAVRVRSISQLFYAAKALASNFHPRGNQLAIVSNGTGPGAMAADYARELSIPLATPTSETVAALKALLPRGWNGANPIDLGGDATPERYLKAIRALVQDANVHATLVVLSPLATAQPQEVACGIVEIARTVRTTLCCCFMGGEQIAAARKILEDAGIPVFRTPDTVIELFHNISRYHRNQKLLLQAPSPGEQSERAGTHGVTPLVEALLGERRSVLSSIEARSLLRTFGIPVLPGMVARNATEAMFAAGQIGLPVSMRLDAMDISRPDERNSRLNLVSLESVRNAFHDLIAGVRECCPEISDERVILESAVAKPQARELMVGLYRDPVFGPVITFGAGGGNVSLCNDLSVALPPLNNFLARDLIDSASVSKTLGAFRHLPPADRSALEKILLTVSNLACELPCVRELSLNPVLLDEHGALVADARIVIDDYRGHGVDRYAHMAIHPYPAHLCTEWIMNDGTVITVRPVKPEDANLERAFVQRLSDDSRRFRFMDAARDLPESLFVRLTQIDYDREMAMIATVRSDGQEIQIGSARYAQTPDGESVEFALAIDDAWQKRNLGRRLMGVIIDCARLRGYKSMVGDVLTDNPKMLRLLTALEFSIMPHPDGSTLKRVVKPLSA